MVESWGAPDACTLPTDERPMRAVEFDGLFAEYLERVDQVGPTEVRMALLGPAGLDEVVRDLTAREAECCSFFEFGVVTEPSVEAGSYAVSLDIRVPPARADVLAALVRRASLARAGRHDG